MIYKKNYQMVITQIKHYKVMLQLSYHLHIFAWQWYSCHDMAVPSGIIGEGISYLGEEKTLIEYYLSRLNIYKNMFKNFSLN